MLSIMLFILLLVFFVDFTREVWVPDDVWNQLNTIFDQNYFQIDS